MYNLRQPQEATAYQRHRDDNDSTALYAAHHSDKR